MKSDLSVNLFLGIAVGAAAALMLAPESGEQFRRRIKKTADEGAGYVKDRGSELRACAAELVDKE